MSELGGKAVRKSNKCPENCQNEEYSLGIWAKIAINIEFWKAGEISVSREKK